MIALYSKSNGYKTTSKIVQIPRDTVGSMSLKFNSSFLGVEENSEVLQGELVWKKPLRKAITAGGLINTEEKVSVHTKVWTLNFLLRKHTRPQHWPEDPQKVHLDARKNANVQKVYKILRYNTWSVRYNTSLS